MKIEKLSQNQIRCILTKEDLLSRQIRVSELVYGSEKAKALFQDMMEEASELGFKAEDNPLMIEAIPVPGESLEIIITRMEDPDELDTRFSKFTDSDIDMEDFDEYDMENERDEEAELPFLGTGENTEEFQPEEEEVSEVLLEDVEIPAIRRIYAFEQLDDLIFASYAMNPTYTVDSSLYKDELKGRYYLLLENPGKPVRPFHMACNQAAEYGSLKRSDGVRVAYLKEHYKMMIEKKAVEKLAGMITK